MRPVGRMGQRLDVLLRGGADMIAPDIRAALDRVALIARMVAMSETIPEARHNLSRLGHALQALGEAAERVEALEASPVPVWWRGQHSDPREWPGNVVAIRGNGA